MAQRVLVWSKRFKAPTTIKPFAFPDCCDVLEVRKKAKIRNRYNQAPHLSQDTALESDKTPINQMFLTDSVDQDKTVPTVWFGSTLFALI